MKKKIVICLLAVMVIYAYSQGKEGTIAFEDIHYFEKIRWTEYYPAASITVFSIQFSYPQAEKYYKFKLYYRDQYRILFCLLGRKGDSFFDFYKPNSIHSPYYIPILGIGKITENLEKEAEGNDSDSISGVYRVLNEKKSIKTLEIERMNNISEYIGYVNMNYNEDGMHFIRYSEEEGVFYSDATYGEECDESMLPVFHVDRNKFMNKTFGVTAYNNDDFKLVIKSYGNCNEKMILKTAQYELECNPEELLIKPGTACVTYGEKIVLYEKPVVEEVGKREFDEVAFDVLERQTKWEEIDGEMSMWYRIRLETGEEGWVWGRNIYLNSKIYSDWWTPR